MSEAKHTPGPWVKVGASIVEASTRNTIAVCTGETDTVDANAHLIAAAPDLLEALRDMVSDRGCLSAATISFAKAAIAKATGSAA